MEWLDLAIWLVAAMLGLALGRGALGHPGFGIAALASVAGLVLCVLFLVQDGDEVWAWGTLAAGVVAVLALSVAVYWLISKEQTSRIGDRDEPTIALLSGLQLPLLGLAAIFAAMMAFDIATVA